MDLLLIAEAPPSAPDRYFYFEDVGEQDSLFRHVARTILKVQPTRENKPQLLADLRERGVFLMDLRQDAVDGSPLSDTVPEMIKRVRKLSPRRIILIKATVYDTAFAALRDAGLPVIDEACHSRVPGSNGASRPLSHEPLRGSLPGSHQPLPPTRRSTRHAGLNAGG